MIKNVFRHVLLVSSLVVCLIAQANISMAYDQSGTGIWNGTNFNIVSYSFSDSSVYAQIVGGNLRLTNAVDQAAAAWAQTPVSTTNSFTTTFSFSLVNPFVVYTPTPPALPFVLPMADGIALAFQSTSNTALGNGGASLGAGGIANIAGSAVQTWSNNRLGLFQGDPSDLTNTHINPAPFDLGNAATLIGTETVSYDATTNFLSMTGSINSIPVSDSLTIDLFALYGPTMYVGFTGGSGLGGSDQEITAWNGINATSPVPIPAAVWLLGTGLVGLLGIRRRFQK